MRRIWLLITFFATATASGAAEIDPLDILERNCITCHHSDDPKGDTILDRSTLQVESLKKIVEMISGNAPEMPKDRPPLSAKEIATLSAWVNSGAIIPKGKVLEDKFIPGRDWWSLKPIQQGIVPDLTGVDGKKWARNPIDAFVLEKLREKNLRPSSEANPRSLIRRLFYDLTGLPPTPEEVEDFVSAYQKDPENTYNSLVDELLESPAYGEHWARHWLDVARYGETHGYDKDKPRPNAWPYRDYVISSFNSDKPWTKFVQEQIAGDALFPNTPDGIVALGFIAAGPWDFISHYEVGEGKVDGRIAKHMDRDDMVSATFNAFMSTTVQCAQCHHHKFDPVSMEDYYRLHSVFSAVDRAPRFYNLDPKVIATRKFMEDEIASLNTKKVEIEASIISSGGQELKRLQEKIKELKANRADQVKKDTAFGYHSGISKDPNTEKWIQLELKQPTSIGEIVLIGCHDDFAQIGAGFGFPLRYRVDISDDAEFKNDVTTIIDLTKQDQSNPGVAPLHLSATGKTAKFIRVTASKLTERKDDFILALAEVQVLNEKGINVASDSKLTSLDSVNAIPRWSLSNLIDGKIPVPENPKAAAILAATVQEEAKLLERINTPEIKKQQESIRKQIREKKDTLAELPPGKMVYAAATHFKRFGRVIPTEGKARPIHLLSRGDIRSPEHEVAPGAPVLWEGTRATFDLAPDHLENERRAALARYLTDYKNPLLWRSIVNRVWLWHFGGGLVDTPNDFGRMGATPSHPELLDWLANNLRNDPAQSLKTLHRLMVTSATWRQSSANQPSMTEIDGDNQYYWKANRRRLSAEELRDSVLVIAGKMNPEMGGPSFQDFVIEKPQHSPHYEYYLHNHDDPKAHRRSIYRMIVRSQTQPFLTTLDCADPSQMVAKRDESTTALQALALMNNPFMETMSRNFADQIKEEPDSLAKAFALATGRLPGHEEELALASYAKTYGLANACRVIFNLSEFVYVD